MSPFFAGQVTGISPRLSSLSTPNVNSLLLILNIIFNIIFKRQSKLKNSLKEFLHNNALNPCTLSCNRPCIFPLSNSEIRYERDEK